MMAGRRFTAASTMPTMTRRVAHARVDAFPGSGGVPGTREAAVAAGGCGSVVGVVVRVVSSRGMRPIIE
ncbi:hypothetical protein GCM10014715_69890 [Streptomyces spiralis]|uniref:Uncharacterized protein n=1 Tax=Streptomyces spiralis TaxID=66376 RepID=A0A919E008_9ACTN|nr:hypothetical protein GCM10014715_69890 [Streptomyces spiralis]